MNCYGVILAGGGGTRFWPLSRKNLPKQFLNLSGADIMVNETIDRLSGNIDSDHVFVVTNEIHKELTESLTRGRIRSECILTEPAARNTAACIGYAAMVLLKKYGDGIMCVLPSDHFIKDQNKYQVVLKQAIDIVSREDCLMTIGVDPSFPATGYGYIKYGEMWEEDCYGVTEFVEKPDLDTAKGYLKQGGYLWNSGMFVWRASTILESFRKLLPDVYQYLAVIGEKLGTDLEQETIREIYPRIPKISIDYGIMERSDNVRVVKADFGWNDVGSWDSVTSLTISDGNGNWQMGSGEAVLLDTSDCIIYSGNKMIATLGVEDLVIVETDDVIMVCGKEKAQDVRLIVAELEKRGKEDYL